VPGTCEIEGTRHLSLLALHVASNRCRFKEPHIRESIACGCELNGGNPKLVNKKTPWSGKGVWRDR
jgi:hypothetical protein